jgi:micrococcal nuclease
MWAMKRKRVAKRMNSTAKLQSVGGMDKKQVTWVAITMIGLLLIALILPLALIVQDSSSTQPNSNERHTISLNGPKNPLDTHKKTKDNPKPATNKKVKPVTKSTPKTKSPTPKAVEGLPSKPGNSEPSTELLSNQNALDSFGLNIEPAGQTETVLVQKVLDGDSLKLADGRKVRLVGIQAPDGRGSLSRGATCKLKSKIEGKEVQLSFDEKAIDRYKRCLAYVFCDGVFINGWMVKNGFAYSNEWKPNSRHSKLLSSLQGQARVKKRGFWALNPPAANHYLILLRSRYFHRPDCKRIAKAKSSPTKIATRELAFDRFLIPCRDCKP